MNILCSLCSVQTAKLNGFFRSAVERLTILVEIKQNEITSHSVKLNIFMFSQTAKLIGDHPSFPRKRESMPLGDSTP